MEGGVHREREPDHWQERRVSLISPDPAMGSTSIRDTIFRRQPILFSLLLVMDSMEKLAAPKVVKSLYEIDARFHLDSEYQTEDDQQFVAASNATTQRIRQRKIRDAYIRRFIQ